MAPSAALIISCAALAAVILQATISWTPIAPSSGVSGKLGMSADVASEGGALSASAAYVPHESRAEVPSGWANIGEAHGATPLNLRIALKSKDVSGLHKALIDMSTPGNAQYGKYLNAKQIRQQYMAPDGNSAKAVVEYHASQGVYLTPAPGYGDYYQFTTTVAQASRLYNASFSHYQHLATGTQKTRTLEYSIPPPLRDHVAFVHPMTSFAKPKQRRSKAVFDTPKKHSRHWSSRDSEASCRKQITPACVQQAYGLPTDRANSSDSGDNSITVTGYLGQFPQDADLHSFLEQFRKDMDASTPFALQTADGGSDPQNASAAGIEANLDTQYTVGIATGVPVNFLSVGDDVHDGNLGGFLDTVNYVSSENAISTVMTTSYDFDEHDLPRPLAVKLCNAYAALGAQGVSVIFSSGDGGVAGTRNDECKRFVPTFPSTCPYVTTVGATTGVPETAASLSAGGFSNYFETPDYQSSAVDAYLSGLGNTYSDLFNASGRAYPDVSAYGQNVMIANGGEMEPVDGTSCAAPIFASVVALLNDRRLAKGHGPLGFLNPWLYANAGAFTDITKGSNPGCGTDGFPATEGWDPVTGLGSPNFAALIDALKL